MSRVVTLTCLKKQAKRIIDTLRTNAGTKKEFAVVVCSV